MEYKYDKTPLRGRIDNYEGELPPRRVDETKWEACRNQPVQLHRYSGFDSSIGGRVKYIITLGELIAGAISFCSAMYRLSPRDACIGWDEKTRVAMLPHPVNNNRFLILPRISIKNSASRVLSRSLQQTQKDWEKQYDAVPYMAETFVDRGQYP